jgi:hypothetical protein
MGDVFWFGNAKLETTDTKGVYMKGDMLKFSCGFFLNVNAEINYELAAALKSAACLTKLEAYGANLKCNAGWACSTGLVKHAARVNGKKAVASTVKNVGQQIKTALQDVSAAANTNINQGAAVNANGQSSQVTDNRQEAAASLQRVDTELTEVVGHEQRTSANEVRAAARCDLTAVNQDTITQLSNEITTSKTLQSANISRITASASKLGVMATITSGINMIN